LNITSTLPETQALLQKYSQKLVIVQHTHSGSKMWLVLRANLVFKAFLHVMNI